MARSNPATTLVAHETKNYKNWLNLVPKRYLWPYLVSLYAYFCVLFNLLLMLEDYFFTFNIYTAGICINQLEMQ